MGVISSSTVWLLQEADAFKLTYTSLFLRSFVSLTRPSDRFQTGGTVVRLEWSTGDVRIHMFRRVRLDSRLNPDGAYDG